MMPTTSASQLLEGVETEVVIQRFADRILVLVSQIGKVGNLIQVSIPPTEQLLPPSTDSSSPESSFLIQPPPAIEITPLLGSAQNDALAALHTLYASHIATLIWTLLSQASLADRLPIVVGVALKKSPEPENTGDVPLFGVNENTRNTFRGVLKMVSELLHV